MNENDKKKRGLGALDVLIIVLILVVAGMAGFRYYRNSRVKANEAAELSNYIINFQVKNIRETSAGSYLKPGEVFAPVEGASGAGIEPVVDTDEVFPAASDDEKVRAELEYKAIAVAHHKDDQAETLLLNIIRGTGIRGLTGMHPANGRIIRPLLCVTRKEILRYLEDKHQEYITDSTNKERDALRNRVRLDLIPMLKEDFNPQIVDMLGRLCENMQESIVAYKYGVEKQFQEYDVHEHRLRLNVKPKDPNLPVILHEWLQGKGFTRSQEKQMLTSKGESGRHWTSGTHVVFCDKNTLTLLPIDFAPEPPRLKQETVEKIEDTSPNVAYFDADELTYPLTIRPVQPGDKMLPFGEHASREIRAILKKTPLSQVARKYAWVVCHGSEIIWLVGVRATNHYRVSYKTKNIIKLSVSDPGFLPDGLKTYVD